MVVVRVVVMEHTGGLEQPGAVEGVGLTVAPPQPCQSWPLHARARAVHFDTSIVQSRHHRYRQRQKQKRGWVRLG